MVVPGEELRGDSLEEEETSGEASGSSINRSGCSGMTTGIVMLLCPSLY